jgi:acyl-coenzyme A thioesterase PaaI-like protein
MTDDSGHPALVGRNAEMGELAGAVRRVLAATVTNRAPADLVGEAARRVAAIAADLEGYVPDPPPPVTHMAPGPDAGMAGLAERMPFDVVIGRCSPLALPLSLEFDPPFARARGTFTSPYEGPPGCIHGGVIAASFDIALSAAAVIAGAAGPTVSLGLRYRRPTLLREEVVFEAEVERREGARTHTVGRLLQRGEVTVEAQAVFAAIDRDRTRALGQTAMGRLK